MKLFAGPSQSLGSGSCPTPAQAGDTSVIPSPRANEWHATWPRRHGATRNSVACTLGIRVRARLRSVSVIGGEGVNTGLAGKRFFDLKETLPTHQCYILSVLQGVNPCWHTSLAPFPKLDALQMNKRSKFKFLWGVSIS
jgi:hypothetical protein